MDPEQPLQPLPGGYYGPSILPRQQPQERRGCSCSGLMVFVAVVVLLCALALAVWLGLRTSDVKVRVTSVSIARFNLTALGAGGDNYNLQYNLSATVVLRNPNRRAGIYYDWLEAEGFYEGERFAWVPLPRFYQGHKNTTTLYPAFAGESGMNLRGDKAQNYELHRLEGAFSVGLRLRGRIRFKIGSLKKARTNMWIECILSIPYAAGRTFTETGCDVDNW